MQGEADAAEAMVKGTNVLPTVKMLRQDKEAVRRLLPVDLHPYLERRILVSSWYPERDQIALMRVLVRLMPQPETECWTILGAAAARDHAAGAYANLLTRGPRHLLEVFPSVWRLVHSHGEWQMEKRQTEDGGEIYRIRLSDFAVGMPEYAGLMEGYFREVLALSGKYRLEVRLVAQDEASATWEIRGDFDLQQGA